MHRFMWVSVVPVDFMYNNLRAHMCRHLLEITRVVRLWTLLLHAAFHVFMLGLR